MVFMEQPLCTNFFDNYKNSPVNTVLVLYLVDGGSKESLNTPFTPDEDYRTTGPNSPNRHLSLVVAPSPLVVTTIRHALS